MSLRFGRLQPDDRERCWRCGWILALLFLRKSKSKRAGAGDYVCRDRERCDARRREAADTERAAMEERR